MINRVILVGRLTKDPELKTTTSGISVATFTLAVGRTYTNAQGTKETDFIPIVVWRRQAENVAQYLRKGSLAGIDGKMQVRFYENQEGRRVYVTEVVAESVQFLEGRNSGDGTQARYDHSFPSEAPSSSYPKPFSQGGDSFNDDPFANSGASIDISEDDLPF